MLIKTSKTLGKIEKRVSCEKCGTRYLYELSRSGRAVSFLPLIVLLVTIAGLPLLMVFVSPLLILPLGGGGFFFFVRFRSGGGLLRSWAQVAGEGGDEECDISANKKLRNALMKGVEPVPCPQCGWYQRDMVWEYRSRQLSWLPWVGLIWFLISAPAAYWLTKYVPNRSVGMFAIGPDHQIQSWLLCILAGGALMLLTFALRWLLALRYTPNEGFPASRAPLPDAPVGVRESDRNANIAQATARITPARRPKNISVRTLPPRALPPPPR